MTLLSGESWSARNLTVLLSAQTTFEGRVRGHPLRNILKSLDVS